jgi:hypothetical protein
MASRLAEIQCSTIDEFDLNHALWVIPAADEKRRSCRVFARTPSMSFGIIQDSFNPASRFQDFKHVHETDFIDRPVRAILRTLKDKS